MAQITDCLKFAKFFARLQKKDKIDLEALSQAMAFFELDPALGAELKAMPKLDDDIVKKFGKPILDAHDDIPLMSLDEAVKGFKQKHQGLNLKERYAADQASTPDQVKAVRAALAPNLRKTLADFKPKALEDAQQFAEELISRLAGHPPASESPPNFPAPPPPPSAKPIETTPPPASPLQPTVSALVLDPVLDKLRVALQEGLLDQPLAASELLLELQARAWGLTPAKLPTTFLLVGPPSCGKSLMTQIIAEAGGHARPILTLNMATMTGRQDGGDLNGVEASYEAARAGRLTAFIRENPRGIVVLDNVDQAHPMVQNRLLPLLTEGWLEDEFGFGGDAKQGHPEGRTVDFRQAIVFLTTTHGAAVYDRRDFLSLYDREPAAVIALLREEISGSKWELAGDGKGASLASALPPYLAQTRILPFRPLGMPALYKITHNSIGALSKQLAGKVSLVIDDSEPQTFPDPLTMALTLSVGPHFNPLELQAVPNRTLLGIYMQLSSTEMAAVRELRVQVQDPQGLLAELRQLPHEALRRDFFRRSQRLKYTVQVGQNDGGATCSLRLERLQIERVPISTDFGGDGGIAIDVPQRKFKEIFGHSYIKDRLQEVVRLLMKPVDHDGNAISLPRGMLLHGRPGTGKTMLAKALAAEAGLPFIAVVGPQLLNLDFIRQVFRLARQYAPSLVFMDEIDALGVRGRGGIDACINQLLTEIDGFDETRDGNVFVIAATNFPSKVDPALTRSGRLDLRLEVPMLDAEARRHFLERLNKLPHVEALNLDVLVEFSAGMSGADLEKLCREATLDLIRRPRPAVTQADLLELLNVIKYGARVERPPLKQQLAATAYHEAGHAVVSLVLNPDVRIEQVSIVARRDALGFTAFNEESMDSRNFTRKEVMDLICVALAGRIAEDRQFPVQADGSGGPDAGASDDLARATRLAWRAITEWGLDEEFGWASLAPWCDDAPPAEWLSEARSRVDVWLHEARIATTRVVDEQWVRIKAVANKLQDDETVDSVDLQKLIKV